MLLKGHRYCGWCRIHYFEKTMNRSMRSPANIGKTATRLRVGDVLERRASSGTIYLQYLGKHPSYGDAVLVCPREIPSPIKPNPDLFADGYITFFPATVAVREGLFSPCGRMTSPDLPTRLRRAGVRKGRHVETWIIEDGYNETVHHRLSDEERRIPIAAIWNIELLTQRLHEGWRPEEEI
jgi:hypothetical protein